MYRKISYDNPATREFLKIRPIILKSLFISIATTIIFSWSANHYIRLDIEKPQLKEAPQSQKSLTPKLKTSETTSNGKTLEEVIKKSKPSIVKIESEGCGGYIFQSTGFFAAPNILVTTAHSIAGADYISVMSNGNSYSAMPLHLDPKADFAILRVDNLRGKPLTLSKYGQSVSVLGMSNGLRGAILGYPDGIYKVKQTIIRDEVIVPSFDIYAKPVDNWHIFELATKTIPGSSGSPLILKNGQVAGVITGTDVENEHITFATPTKEFYRKVEQAKSLTKSASNHACVPEAVWTGNLH